LPISGASGNQQKSSVARSSPPNNSDTDCGQTPCDIPPFKLLSEESASCGKSWAAWTDSATAVNIKDAPSPSSFGVGLDNEVCTSTDRPSNSALNTAIPLFSLTPPTVNISPHLNDGKDDACSQGSSSLFAVEKAPAIETDLYLTANESSSNVSVTPPKKSRINAAGVEVSSDGSRKDRRCPAAVDGSLLNGDAANAADVTQNSRRLPPIKLEIPESRRFMVLVSEVESPDRFWVNVPSNKTPWLDWVTDILNTSSLKPADCDSIKLEECYCARSATHEGFFRAEVIEICYGEDRCKRGLSDSKTPCDCNQLVTSPAAAIKAVRVCHHCL